MDGNDRMKENDEEIQADFVIRLNSLTRHTASGPPGIENPVRFG